MHHRACSVILVVQNLEYQLKKTKNTQDVLVVGF